MASASPASSDDSNEQQRRRRCWTEYVDDATGVPYYYDSVSGETTWTVPESWKDRSTSSSSFVAAADAAATNGPAEEATKTAAEQRRQRQRTSTITATTTTTTSPPPYYGATTTGGGGSDGKQRQYGNRQRHQHGPRQYDSYCYYGPNAADYSRSNTAATAAVDRRRQVQRHQNSRSRTNGSNYDEDGSSASLYYYSFEKKKNKSLEYRRNRLVRGATDRREVWDLLESHRKQQQHQSGGGGTGGTSLEALWGFRRREGDYWSDKKRQAYEQLSSRSSSSSSSSSSSWKRPVELVVILQLKNPLRAENGEENDAVPGGGRHDEETILLSKDADFNDRVLYMCEELGDDAVPLLLLEGTRDDLDRMARLFGDAGLRVPARPGDVQGAIVRRVRPEWRERFRSLKSRLLFSSASASTPMTSKPQPQLEIQQAQRKGKVKSENFVEEEEEESNTKTGPVPSPPRENCRSSPSGIDSRRRPSSAVAARKTSPASNQPVPRRVTPPLSDDGVASAAGTVRRLQRDDDDGDGECEQERNRKRQRRRRSVVDDGGFGTAYDRYSFVGGAASAAAEREAAAEAAAAARRAAVRDYGETGPNSDDDDDDDDDGVVHVIGSKELGTYIEWCSI